MPYHVIRYKNGWVVANQHTGKHYSKHAMTKENAEAQMKAMYLHMRPNDIRPQPQLSSPPDIRPQHIPRSPPDMLAHLNPHLQ